MSMVVLLMVFFVVSSKTLFEEVIIWRKTRPFSKAAMGNLLSVIGDIQLCIIKML